MRVEKNSMALLGERRILAAGILGAALVALAQSFNVRRMSYLPRESRGRLGALAGRILPQTSWEMRVFVLLALTARLRSSELRPDEAHRTDHQEESGPHHFTLAGCSGPSTP